jgi:hypothetical protein
MIFSILKAANLQLFVQGGQLYRAFSFNKGSLVRHLFTLLLDRFKMIGSSGGNTKMHHFKMRTSYLVSYDDNLAIALRESA